MGCSASTHAGVGIYSIPNDELGESDDRSRSAGEFDVNHSCSLKRPSSRQPQGRRPQRGDRQGRRLLKQQSNARRRPNDNGRQQGRDSRCAPPSCQQQMGCSRLVEEADDNPCGMVVCQNEAGSSPERLPMPPNHGEVNVTAAAAGTSSSSGGAAAMTQPLQQLNESFSTWNNSLVQVQDSSAMLNSSLLNTSILNSSMEATIGASVNFESPGSTVNQAFSSRRWMVLPEHQYDMNTAHPSLPPFLGSMYWIAATPPSSMQRRRGHDAIGSVIGRNGCPVPAMGRHGRHPRGDSNDRRHVPSLITPCSSNGSPEATFTKFGIQPQDVHNQTGEPPSSLAQHGADKLLLSLDFTEGWSEDTSVSSEAEEDEFGELQGIDLMSQLSPRESVDISRELLDYSQLEESFILEAQRSHQAPRRLFDEDDSGDMIMGLDESFEVEYAGTPTSKTRQQQQRKGHVSNSSRGRLATQKLQRLLCMAPNLASTTISVSDDTMSLEDPPLPKKALAVGFKPSPPPTCPSSPNVATFYGHWGSRRERHFSTLPSPIYGEPIRLRVTESGLSGGHSNHHSFNSSRSTGSGINHTMSNHTHNSSPGDFFSYDPYFSTGKYTITLPTGNPYGNGLVMKMGCEFMILEDSRGCVLAVIKSLRTHTPSTVVYAPKARFAGQIASGHRLTRQTKGCGGGGKKRSIAVVVDGNNDGMMTEGEALYPWALISKDGRTMRDDCTVHLVNDDAKGSSKRGAGTSSSSKGIFNTKPTFCGRHGFDERQLHTHTVVSRTTTTGPSARDRKQGNIGMSGSNTHSSGSASLEDAKPCCVIVRDPTNLDAADITIAPGIDPLLMICYLASHSKMDVEPLMSGY